MPTTTTDPTPARAVTFQDLDRACTKWLLARDPAYRRTYEKYQPQRDARNARVAAKKAAAVLPQ